MVSDAELSRQIKMQVDSKMVILMYDRILRHRKIAKNKSDTLWNINLYVPARRLKGILMFFEDPDRTNTETYYNPKILKVEITIKGVPNQLYTQSLNPRSTTNTSPGLMNDFRSSMFVSRTWFRILASLFFPSDRYGPRIVRK